MKKTLKYRNVLLWTMRITATQFIFALMFLGTGYAREGSAQSLLGQRISINAHGSEVKKILNQVEKQVDVRFVFSSKLIKSTRKITVAAHDKPLYEVLDQVLTPLGLRYELSGKIIILKRGEVLPEVAPQSSIKKEVSGRVVDESDMGLPGVSVVLKGTQLGTITDNQGAFKLDVPDNGVLVFSFVGFETQEAAIGSQSIFNISLVSDTKMLDAIVVTALGFKESADKLGSTSSKITDKSISASGETSLLNKIAGKASGVFVGRSSGSDPGGGSFVQIRGASTLSGGSQPLYIVDGVPINSSVHGGTNIRGVVQQSRVNDINPEDIASIQVLKGASAAALWGSRAANGVIVITTKNGSYNDKMRISFKTSYSLDVINRHHKRQDAFGQGDNGRFNPASGNAWGDKIESRAGGADDVNTSGQFFEGYSTGQKYYPIVRKNSRENFANDQFNAIFRNGYAAENSLSLSGGGANSNYLFSISDVYQKGVFRENSDYRRSTIRLNIESKLHEIVKLSTHASYAMIKSERVQRSNNTAGMLLGYYRMTPDFDITDYKGSYYSGPNAAPVLNRQRSYRNYMGSSSNPVYNNPLWTMIEQRNPNMVNRFIGSTELTITPIKGLDIINRFGIDNSSDVRKTFFPVNSAAADGVNLGGRYGEMTILENQLNYDLIGRYNHDFNKNFSASLIGGFNLNDRKYSDLGGEMTDFLIADGPLNFSNSQTLNRNPSNSRTQIRSARAYSVLGLSFYNSLFFNFSFAGEAASTFGKASNNTFYYPSGDIAWQFTKLQLFEKLNWLSFGKLRASYGVVGVQPAPYRTATLFVPASALYGNGSYRQSPNFGNDQLRPERKTEYEIGTDLRFFGNRLRTEITYYNNKTTDLLLSVPVPNSTGFTSSYQNAGTLQNKGIDLDLNYDVLRMRDLKLSLNFNLNRNRSLVTNLAGATAVQVGGIDGYMTINALEGHPVGVFRGGHYVRDDQGNKVFDANGFPMANAADAKIGDPNPNWRGGFGANLSYKSFSLGLLFETFQGGDFFEGTRGVMYSHGTHEDVGKEVTLTKDLKNFRGNVIPAGTTVRGNIRDLGAGEVLLDESYYTTLGGGFSGLKEQFVVDGSWTRLREVSLGYTLQTESFRRSTKLQSLEFRLSGRNLFLWSGVRGIDPDSNHTQVSLGRGMDYFDNPGTKSYLFSLLINY
jgi:TonB-linked SusC/RagA family outer membrane protein